MNLLYCIEYHEIFLAACIDSLTKQIQPMTKQRARAVHSRPLDYSFDQEEIAMVTNR